MQATNFSFGDLQERFEKLPEDIKSAIVSADMGQKLSDIGKKYKLHIDQSETLFDETGLVLFGVTKPDSFSKTIEKSISCSSEIAEQIEKDISESIFQPIRASLIKIHSSDSDEDKTSDKSIIPSTAKSNTDTDTKTLDKLPTLPTFPSLTMQKMTGAVQMPKQEINIKGDSVVSTTQSPTTTSTSIVTASPTSADKQTNTTPIQKGYSVDPYRELP